ncbi:MAG: JAB domain-containing protein [Paenibacillaceae bacterium]
MKRISLYSLKLVKEKSRLYNVDTVTIKQPEDMYTIVSTVLNLQFESVEHFGILALNAKNLVVGLHVLAIGTIDAAIINQREIFKAALLNNASYVIMFHNHPSGDPTPSQDDITVTKQMELAGQIMGIPILDHIIIGESSFVSLRETHAI